MITSPPFVTAILAAIFGLFAAALTLNVIVSRVRLKVESGDGGPPAAAPSAPAEQPLDVVELELDVGRPPVVALAGMGRRLHLAEQRIHLRRVEPTAGPHAAMAGERAADLLEPLAQRQRGPP